MVSIGSNHSVGLVQRYGILSTLISQKSNFLSALGLPLERPKCMIRVSCSMFSVFLTYFIAALSMDALEKLIKSS